MTDSGFQYHEPPAPPGWTTVPLFGSNHPDTSGQRGPFAGGFGLKQSLFGPSMTTIWDPPPFGSHHPSGFRLGAPPEGLGSKTPKGLGLKKKSNRATGLTLFAPSNLVPAPGVLFGGAPTTFPPVPVGLAPAASEVDSTNTETAGSSFGSISSGGSTIYRSIGSPGGGSVPFGTTPSP